MLLGITMFANVWLVIWPNQKKVIANARNVLAGGEADPEAAAAGRQGAPRVPQNTIFSFTMLFFMVGTSHFFGQWATSSAPVATAAIYWAITIVIWLVLELNALGVLGGTAPGGPRVIYDNHKQRDRHRSRAHGRVVRALDRGVRHRPRSPPHHRGVRLGVPSAPMRCSGGAGTPSEAEQARDALAVLGRCAEQERARLRPTHVAGACRAPTCSRCRRGAGCRPGSSSARSRPPRPWPPTTRSRGARRPRRW